MFLMFTFLDSYEIIIHSEMCVYTYLNEDTSIATIYIFYEIDVDITIFFHSLEKK